MAFDNAYPTSTTQLTTMAQWEGLFTGLGATGIVPGVGSGLLATLQSGPRTVTLAPGAALVRGFYAGAGSSTVIAVPAASGQNRIDRLVLRLDRTAAAAADWVKPVIIQGTPSTAPQTPAISTSPSGNWDLTICRWTSASNGGLSGLADERYDLAPANLVFHSSAPPAPSPAEACLGFEWDTGRVVWFHPPSGTWRSLFEDTGNVALSLASGWEASGSVLGRKLSGVVDIDLNVKRTVSAITEGTEKRITTLPVSLRPTSHNRYFTGIFSGDVLCRIDVQPDGAVMVRQFTANVPIGAELRTTLTYLQ